MNHPLIFSKGFQKYNALLIDGHTKNPCEMVAWLERMEILNIREGLWFQVLDIVQSVTCLAKQVSVAIKL